MGGITDNIGLIQSILPAVNLLESGTAIVNGAFSKTELSNSSTILSSAFNPENDVPNSQDSFTEFVNTYVENPGDIFADLAAIQTLNDYKNNNAALLSPYLNSYNQNLVVNTNPSVAAALTAGPVNLFA